MASISYTLKVAPYEVAEYPGSRFDKRSEILDTKTIRLEFDLETLPVEDRTLFWNVLGIQPKIAFGKNTNIVLMTYELDRGYDPTGIQLQAMGRAARIEEKPFQTIHELSFDEAWRMMEVQYNVFKELTRKRDEINARHHETITQLSVAEQERVAEEKAAAQAMAEIAYAEACVVDWNSEGKWIGNLYQKLVTVSEIEMDSRFTSNWIKQVTGFNQGGGANVFDGSWVNDRTVEIDNRNSLYLVAGTSGSRNHNTTYYRFVMLRDGRLEATDIRADNSDAGWALAVRNRVQALLEQLRHSEPLPSVRRYHQLIQQLRDVQTELSRVESADRFNGLILKADEMLGDLINALLILGD